MIKILKTLRPLAERGLTISRMREVLERRGGAALDAAEDAAESAKRRAAEAAVEAADDVAEVTEDSVRALQYLVNRVRAGRNLIADHLDPDEAMPVDGDPGLRTEAEYGGQEAVLAHATDEDGEPMFHDDDAPEPNGVFDEVTLEAMAQVAGVDDDEELDPATGRSNHDPSPDDDIESEEDEQMQDDEKPSNDDQSQTDVQAGPGESESPAAESNARPNDAERGRAAGGVPGGDGAQAPEQGGEGDESKS